MTSFATVRKNTLSYLPTLAALLATAALIFRADEMREAFISGTRLAVCTVLPSVFPFMILSDMLSSSGMRLDGAVGRRLRRLLRMNGESLSVLTLGLICGFPICARTASAAYADGRMDKSGCELICATASNPSAVFTISTVGALFGDMRIGALSYVCVALSSIFTTVFHRPCEENTLISRYNSRQKFNFVSSTKSAGLSSITVSSFIIVFSVILSLLKPLTKNATITALVSCPLEIGNTVFALTSAPLEPHIRLCLLGFSLGFSGLSALMQIFSFLPPEISRLRIVTLKLEQGFLCALLALSCSFLL